MTLGSPETITLTSHGSSDVRALLDLDPGISPPDCSHRAEVCVSNAERLHQGSDDRPSENISNSPITADWMGSGLLPPADGVLTRQQTCRGAM
jgi:hypothetical protein